MAHTPLLHELLQEDQEPFNLKTHIANKLSHLKKSSPKTTLQLRKRRSIIDQTPTKSVNLCKHACFFSFNASPDIRSSPFLEVASPSRSPSAAVFLHIPSRTAAVLAEAAIRIQKQQPSNPKPYAKTGIGLLGSLLKRLADRSKNRKRAIEDCDIVRVYEEKVEESVRMSCSCSNRRLNKQDRTVVNEDKSLDFEASTSSRVSESSEDICGGFCSGEESCFNSSRFRFSLQKCASSSGRRTPEICSPAASPSRRAKQENANCEPRNSDNSQGEEDEEEKEQCSPVSVLDPPFDEEEEEEEEEDFDMECSYDNVQRAKQQLMYRLQRFEKLAELDPVELDRKLLEEDAESDESEHNLETSACQVLRESSLKYHRRRQNCDNEVVREVDFNAIDMMIGLDLKEFDVWTKLGEQVEDTVAEIELAIYAMLLDELTGDVIRSRQQMEIVK